MNRRRFIWQEAETQSGLPSSYTAVDYLQASGGQWIDTGYRYGAGSDIEVKFGASADGTLLGAQDSDDAMYKFAIVDATPLLWIARGQNGYSMSVKNMQKPFVLRNIGNLFKVTDSEGTEKTVTIEAAGYVGSQQSVYLFARHNKSGIAQKSKSQIYYCRFYENGELVCDMRPCLNADGVPCMYDLIRRRTLYNQGTGSFTWG
ncbi:MAG: hypothetical protein U0N38_08790 [Acutalibacteraceae bacterium]|nr:MAG TPA: hypothetical protein [Caudoviricetes sp.]